MREIIFFIVFMMLILCSCEIRNEHKVTDTKQENIYINTNINESISQSDEDIIEIVNHEISGLTGNNDYINANINDRKKLVLEMLNKLSDLGYIKGQYYDEKNKLFSFQYIDGTLGGIEIMNDFSTEIDGLFLN